MNSRLLLVVGFTALSFLSSPAAERSAAFLPEGVTLSAAQPKQLKEIMIRLVETRGVPEARKAIPVFFKELDCKEIRKAAALTEGYIAAAQEDIEYFVRRAISVQPCFASVIVATAVGKLPEQRDAIVASAKEGVADYLVARNGAKGGKVPVSIGDDDLAAYPELAAATDRAIELAAGAGARNGPADLWMFNIPSNRPFFLVDDTINPGGLSRPGRRPRSGDARPPRPPRPPRDVEVSPSGN